MRGIFVAQETRLMLSSSKHEAGEGAGEWRYSALSPTPT